MNADGDRSRKPAPRAGAGSRVRLKFLRAAHEVLSARSQNGLAATALLLVAFVGALDHVVGYEISFSIFYLLPVAIAAWYGRKRLGIFVCAASAAAWLWVDYTAGHVYSHPAIPFWNAVVRFLFFLVTADLFVRLREALETQTLLSQEDGLTGLLNARAFRQRCDPLAQLAGRYGRPMTVGFLDVDGFKAVNDTLGHAAGDRVLQEIAKVIVARSRVSDLVGRVGGDEFAALLPETNLAGARTYFDDLHDRLVELAARNAWPIGFSIGVAVFRSPPVETDDAINLADELMYAIKSAGRNGVRFEEYAGTTRLTRQTV